MRWEQEILEERRKNEELRRAEEGAEQLVREEREEETEAQEARIVQQERAGEPGEKMAAKEAKSAKIKARPHPKFFAWSDSSPSKRVDQAKKKKKTGKSNETETPVPIKSPSKTKSMVKKVRKLFGMKEKPKSKTLPQSPTPQPSESSSRSELPADESSSPTLESLTASLDRQPGPQESLSPSDLLGRTDGVATFYVDNMLRIYTNKTNNPGPPADNIKDLLVRSFKHHTRGKKGTRPIRVQARSLATEIMGAIRWAQSFVPPSKASVDLLSNLLEGYIVAVNETAGWALEVDDRWENQAKVVAKREFKQGEIIPHLDGLRATLTEQEEDTLRRTGRDFSVG